VFLSLPQFSHGTKASNDSTFLDEQLKDIIIIFACEKTCTRNQLTGCHINQVSQYTVHTVRQFTIVLAHHIAGHILKVELVLHTDSVLKQQVVLHSHSVRTCCVAHVHQVHLLHKQACLR